MTPFDKAPPVPRDTRVQGVDRPGVMFTVGQLLSAYAMGMLTVVAVIWWGSR